MARIMTIRPGKESPCPSGATEGTGRAGPFSEILWYRTKFSAGKGGIGAQRTFLVFGGVEWDAQVWLNGKPLGSHRGYYEPFHFDVTGLLREKNTLAVRVIAGPKFGEPSACMALFPMSPARDQRYVRDQAQSIRGFTGGDLHLGAGYGIHREVFLESTGRASVTEIFARANPQSQQATIIVEADDAGAKSVGGDENHSTPYTLDVQIMPENFEGRSYRAAVACDLPRGPGKRTINVPMPEAKPWTPATPYLYRCRVSIFDGRRLVDAKDVLFGCRSFTIVSRQHPCEGLPEGMFLLNGKPLYLRGTNFQGLNVPWYWGQQDRLVDMILMVKAANFNAIRSDQYVCYAEVRELLDRLGMMSQQDQGSGGGPRYTHKTPEIGGVGEGPPLENRGFVPGNVDQMAELPRTGTMLARACYNNPGVVLLSFGNETYFDADQGDRSGAGGRSPSGSSCR